MMEGDSFIQIAGAELGGTIDSPKDIRSLSVDDLKRLRRIISKQIDNKTIMDYVQADGYFITYKEYDIDGLNLAHCQLEHKVSLTTWEKDNDPHWEVGRMIVRSEKMAWEHYLSIYDKMPSDISYDAPTDQSEWSFGDWDDPIRCFGNVKVNIYFTPLENDPIPHEQYLVIPEKTGIINVMNGDKLTEEFFCGDYVILKGNLDSL